MKRTIWFWIYFVLAILLAIYFASRIIMIGLGHGDNARVRRVSISADATTRDLGILRSVATPAPGTHTYTINLTQLNDRIINEVPGVKYSAVRRRPDGNLAVKVKFHQAVALWTDDGETFYPLSADGTIVKRPTDVRAPGTVLFRGDVPSDIDEITRATQTLAGDLDYLEWIEKRRWDLYTTGGIRILLPEESPIAAINTIVNMHKNHKILSRQLDVIDMRDNARILIK